jgi:hypothetical protein
MTTQGSTPGLNGTVSTNGPDILWVLPTSPSPSPSPIKERLIIIASPDQVPVNGSVTITTNYTVNDKPVPGKVVTFEVIRPDGSKIYPKCTTDAFGELPHMRCPQLAECIACSLFADAAAILCLRYSCTVE